MSQRPQKKIVKTDEDLQGPTTNLAIINGLFYLITVYIGGGLIFTGDRAIILFGFSVNNFLAGLLWTPLTAIFTHASITHIGGNIIFLFIYGFKLEERGYGKGIYFVYIATGILSTVLAGPLIGITAISVGASGAVFGLLGANAGIERRERSSNYRSVLFSAIILFILSTGARTNVFGHLFGLIFGFLIGVSPYFERFKDIEIERASKYMN